MYRWAAARVAFAPQKEATYRAIRLSEFREVPILIVHLSIPAAATHIG